MKKYGFIRERLRWVMLQKHMCKETSTRVQLLRVAWPYTISSLSPQSFKIFKITESKAICIRAGHSTLTRSRVNYHVVQNYERSAVRPNSPARRSVEWNNWKHWCERCPWSDSSIKFAGRSTFRGAISELGHSIYVTRSSFQVLYRFRISFDL